MDVYRLDLVVLRHYSM